MMFGLILIFSGSASAQKALFAVGSGSGTPKAGDVLRDSIHARRNDEPNAPSGTKYFSINFLAGGKGYAGALAQIPSAEQKQWEVKSFGDKTITKVENPVVFRAYDGLNVDYSKNGLLVVDVIRNKKSVGVMKIYYK